MKKLNALILVIALCLSFTGVLEARRPMGVDENVPEPEQSHFSKSMNRLGSGFSNIAYGPLEVFYNLKEESKRDGYFKGAVPGLVKGLMWFGIREGVGIFEVVTFAAPMDPHLEPFNTEWLSL